MAVAKGPQNNTPRKKHDATHPLGLASVEMSPAGWRWLFVARRTRRKNNKKAVRTVSQKNAAQYGKRTRDLEDIRVLPGPLSYGGVIFPCALMYLNKV